MWEDVHETIDQGLIRDAVAAILMKLSDRHRTVVVARHEFGMTYKEIGNRYKVSPSRVSQIESKAMRILRSEKFMKEYKKLGIPWIDNYFVRTQREEKKVKEELEKRNREGHRICVEKKIAREKERKAREKLRIVDSDIPKPEAIVKPYSPKPPYFPPYFVKLFYNDKNEPYLHVDIAYGSIDRRLDPETYDRWLNHLIQNQKGVCL